VLKSDHPSSAEVKNEWSYTSTPPLESLRALRTTLLLDLTLTIN
jgi:hypothetical protein